MRTATNFNHPASQACLGCRRFALEPLDIPDDSHNVPKIPRWGTCSLDGLFANVAYWCEEFEKRQFKEAAE